jgi:hypothetical protein
MTNSVLEQKKHGKIQKRKRNIILPKIRVAYDTKENPQKNIIPIILLL